MSEAEQPQSTPPLSAPAGPARPPRKERHGLNRLRPYAAQALVLVLGVSLLSNVGLWLHVRDLEKGPTVAVVGVREMTQSYLRRVATSDVTPDEAAIRAKAFLAVAQDQMSRMVTTKGRLVLARECVLSGEAQDLTPELASSVEKKLAAATGGLSEHVGPISPLPASPVGRP